MFAEHTNKKKMPCKPQSRYHLKGYAIIIIRVITALLTTREKSRWTTGRNSTCWQKRSLPIISVRISPSLMPKHTIRACTTWAGSVPNMRQPEGIIQLIRVKNTPAATLALPPRAAWRAPAGLQPTGVSHSVMGPITTTLVQVLQKVIPELPTDSKGIQGQLLDRFPFLEMTAGILQCSCPEPLSAGTPGRGSPAASGQTWPGSCCLPQRRQGLRAQQYNLSCLRHTALCLQPERPASPKTQELAALAKGVMQVWKVSFWKQRLKS